jgi:hypothetical protein
VGNPYAPPEPGRPQQDRPPAPPPRQYRPAPSGPPHRPPPDPATVRRAGTAVGRFALLMLAGLLCLELPVPWQAAGIVFTGLGIVVGVQAIRRVAAAGMRGTLIASLGIGLAMAGIILLLQIAMLALWPAAFRLQECRADALTISAEDQCLRDYERSVIERTQLGSLDVVEDPAPAAAAPSWAG